MSKSTKKLTIEYIREEIKNIDLTIEILSEHYINSKNKLQLKCKICNNKWETSWNRITNKVDKCEICREKNSYHTFDSVKEYIENENYKLIHIDENTVPNKLMVKVKVKIGCQKGHIYDTNFGNFHKGNRCPKCMAHEAKYKIINNSDEVRLFIEKLGFIIVEPFTYENNKTKFNILCPNGHLLNVHYNYFSRKQSCAECELGRKYKYPEEHISAYFAEKGCVFLNKEKSKISYVCECGNESTTSFDAFKKGKRCNICAGNKKYTLEEIKNIFSNENCKLLTTSYKNNKQLLEYECSCGNISSITLSNFLNGHRCEICYRNRNTGENHPNWNPLITDGERINKRKFNEYAQWRSEVFQRDNYTCQCCGDKSGHNLKAHHLNGWNWAIDERVSVGNGVTLCDTCHDDFHGMYGYGDNTREQYEEWLEDILQMSS